MITVAQVKAELKKQTWILDRTQSVYYRQASIGFISIDEHKDNVSRYIDNNLRYNVTYYTGGLRSNWSSKGGFGTLGKAVNFAKEVYAVSEKRWDDDVRYGGTEAFFLSKKFELVKELEHQEEPVQEQQAQEMGPVTMTKSEMFKEAHRMAKAWRANPDTVHTYKEAFAIALKIVWTATKSRSRKAA